MPIEKQKTYLKTLAEEHGEHFNTYINSMQEFDGYLSTNFKITIDTLKGKVLRAWQVHLLRRLNPTEFEINSMQEIGTYDEWLKWFSEVRNFNNTHDSTNDNL